MSGFITPRGFRTNGSACGLKDSGHEDLSLFVSDQPCTSAGVFTQNRVVGAPVIVSRDRVPASTTRAVVINSGNANACTGERGISDAQRMTTITAEQLHISETDVLVCSTGVIGHFLPMDTIARGIRETASHLGRTPEHLNRAARGMMTTDTVTKIATRQFVIDGEVVTVTGVAKGAAMIGPNMATMLAVVMTDCILPAETAQSLLGRSREPQLQLHQR